MELVPAMPADFLESQTDWSAKRRQAENLLAQAYWDRALTTIQWRYSFGSRLPERPPEEFAVDAREFGDAIKLAPKSRERYWEKLREAWELPRSWHEVREWNFDWARDPLKFWREAVGSRS